MRERENHWAGHWHGYGPWTGAADILRNEAARRPGVTAGDPATREFVSGTVPPVQVGHCLLRRTPFHWTDLDDVVDWLTKNYAQQPPVERPDGRAAYLALEARITHAREALRHGVDVVWSYYTGSYRLVDLSVVCCPHRFLSGLVCPRPLPAGKDS